MTTQPEALRLAEELDAGENFYAESSMYFDRKLAETASECADELRRLYAENEALRGMSFDTKRDMETEALLRQALEALLAVMVFNPTKDEYAKGRAAITALRERLGVSK